MGWWADTNYIVDAPMVLNKDHAGYKFDKLVSFLYGGVVEQFAKEATNHAYRPFGCDMAFVDATVNYKIMDRLLEVWDELGYSKEIEIRYSTPTQYLKEVIKASNKTDVMWPIRKDDTFPYA